MEQIGILMNVLTIIADVILIAIIIRRWKR